ncbi:MAG: hypothetical protein M3Y53_11275, partial [Thermoproteota archaeon]|nr:hypothetical protein [Thermoproteota archaeon]
MDICNWSTVHHDRLRGGKSDEYLGCIRVFRNSESDFPKIRFIHFTVENNNIILQNILILNHDIQNS